MTSEPEKLLPVIQADRDAMARYENSRPVPLAPAFALAIVQGKCDTDDRVQAFARHRLSSPVSGTDMVLVPREMTQAMLDATCATAADDERMRAVWEDLLYAAKAASPPAPVEASERGGRALFEHEMQQRGIAGEDADWADVDSDERALWTASANAVIAALSASPSTPIPVIAEAGNCRE